MLSRVITSLLVFAALPAMADHPSLSAGGQSSGPLVTTSAQPMPRGELAAGIDVQWLSFDSVTDAELSGYSSAVHLAGELYQYSLAVRYGAGENLTLGASLPYLDRRDLRENHHHNVESGGALAPLELLPHEHGDEAITRLGNSEGMGDLRLQALWRIWRRDTQQVALLGGVKLPTGDSSTRDRQGRRFEAEMQPGSGSVDASLGVAFTWQRRAWSLDSNLLYTLADEGAQHTDLGDVAQANLALSFRQQFVAEHHHGEAVHHHRDNNHYLDWILEVNAEWRGQLEIDGVVERNSGGNMVYLAPGLRWGFAASTALGLSVGLPVLENLRGLQSEAQSRIILSVSRGF